MRLIPWLVLGVLTVAGCSLPAISGEKTVGEQFREVLAEIDKKCREEKVGPYLDPRDPEYKGKRRETQCNILLLKSYDPFATPGGRFAHSLKLPAPYDKPRVGYRPGKSGEEYFNALCAAEAGEHVFRAVNGVEGIWQARPFNKYPSGYLPIVFYAREKGEMSDVDKPQDYMVQPYLGRYDYLELSLPAEEARRLKAPYERYFRDINSPPKRMYQTAKDGRFVSVPYIVASMPVDALRSMYGYLWRGMRRESDVEHGIEGSELIIFERATNEVLAFRRQFTRYTPDRSAKDRRETNVATCPAGFSLPPHRFIQSVLIPTNRE